MPLPKFTFPTRLRGVDGQEPDKLLWMRADIVRHVLVVDPQSTEPRLATEDNGPLCQRSSRPVFVIANRQIDLVVSASALRLALKGFAKMLRVLPGVTVDIDGHGEIAACAEAGRRA